MKNKCYCNDKKDLNGIIRSKKIEIMEVTNFNEYEYPLDILITDNLHKSEDSLKYEELKFSSSGNTIENYSKHFNTDDHRDFYNESYNSYFLDEKLPGYISNNCANNMDVTLSDSSTSNDLLFSGNQIYKKRMI
ncbi:hypothetical protein TCON_0739 [Astathelohania contejeani]|uniref:Acetyl-CoA carboxylase beta subunit n=1 Tax=Astathelohania contejeani TaxID=164912 RepID=A0ABQ7I0S3_9MICR|nr:hypothetical protein TCON_0739 [Thelohania contejeani]